MPTGIYKRTEEYRDMCRKRRLGQKLPISTCEAISRAQKKGPGVSKFDRLLRRQYSGFTEDQYHSLLESHKGLCAICKRPETCKRNKRLSIDHNHTTGKVRGLLCDRCNHAIGYFKENHNIINGAILYIRHNKPLDVKYNRHMTGHSGIFEALFERQHGACAICEKQETALNRFGTLQRLATDHDHDSGNIRGLLCSNCNHGIGLFKESVEILERAIEYLSLHCETNS